MEKFPFTPQGVMAICQQLYQLNNVDLHAQADALELDFKEWVMANLLLTNEQTTYLEELHADMIRLLRTQLAVAVRNRLSITLIKPLTSGLRETKLIETKSETEANTLVGGVVVITGQLTIEVSY